MPARDTFLPSRRSIRLRDYDYLQAGAYFVTVCTFHRECLFGEIAGDVMRLNEAGQLVADIWADLPARFPSVDLDAFVVMPNHVHGIVVLGEAAPSADRPGSVGAGLAPPGSDPSSTANNVDASSLSDHTPTLGDVMSAFKSLSAIVCNRVLDRMGIPFWQRSYYEHIIRSDDDLTHIRKYIAANPARWAEDRENPALGSGR